jgi:hypothetical protein
LCFRDAEQDDAADAERPDFLALADEVVDRHLVVARHRRDLALHSFAGADEEGENEIAGGW